ESPVMEATFRQVRIGASVEPADAVFFSVFVRDNDHRDGPEPPILLDLPHELDTIHPGHVDVAYDQIIMRAADCIPAVNAVYCHITRVSRVDEHLPFELPDGDRIVDDQNSLGRTDLFLDAFGGELAEPTPRKHVVDRANEILDVDDQDRP